MTQLNKATIAAIALSSMAFGGIGAWVFAPATGNAAPTSTTTPNANNGANNAPSGGFRSNEDPTHEQNESPQREAEENSGQANGHCPHGSDNGGPSGGSTQPAQPTEPGSSGAASNAFGDYGNAYGSSDNLH